MPANLRRVEKLLEDQFATIFRTRQPRIDVTAKDLADSLIGVIEGTVILGRSWDDRHLMTRRIRQYRQTLTLLFDAKKEFPDPSAVAEMPTGTIQRIAFGSCAKHWQYQPIWETVISTQPDLFLFLGDAIYADNDGATAWDVTEKQLQGEWNRLADKPEYQRFRAEVPIMATWDNHDYGTHNGGADFKLKEVSKKMFLDFFGEPTESERRRRPGIYDAKVFGPEGKRVQIILLDTRTFRGPFKRDERTKEERLALGKVGGYLPQDDTEATVLGDAQWAWLEKQLRQPAEVRLVCSSTQIIPDSERHGRMGLFSSRATAVVRFDRDDRSRRSDSTERQCSLCRNLQSRIEGLSASRFHIQRPHTHQRGLRQGGQRLSGSRPFCRPELRPRRNRLVRKTLHSNHAESRGA